MSDSFEQEKPEAGIVFGDCEATVVFECGDKVVIKKPALWDFYEVLKFCEQAFDGLDFIRKGFEDANAGKAPEIGEQDVKGFLCACVEKVPKFIELLTRVTGNQVTDTRMKERGRKAMNLDDLWNVCRALWELAELGKYKDRFIPGAGAVEKQTRKRGRPSKKLGSESETSSEASTEQSQENS